MSLPVCTFLLDLNVGVRVCQSHLPENKCQELLIQITSGEDVGDGEHATAKEVPGLYKESLITISHSVKYMQRKRRYQHCLMPANGVPQLQQRNISDPWR